MKGAPLSSRQHLPGPAPRAAPALPPAEHRAVPPSQARCQGQDGHLPRGAAVGPGGRLIEGQRPLSAASLLGREPDLHLSFYPRGGEEARDKG